MTELMITRTKTKMYFSFLETVPDWLVCSSRVQWRLQRFNEEHNSREKFSGWPTTIKVIKILPFFGRNSKLCQMLMNAFTFAFYI